MRKRESLQSPFAQPAGIRGINGEVPSALEVETPSLPNQPVQCIIPD